MRELPREDIGPADVDAKEDCPVCKEEYTVGEQVMKLPCNHRFHIDCLQPWLKMRNTCPVCRYALPSATTESSSSIPPTSNVRPSSAPDAVPSPPDLSSDDDDDDIDEPSSDSDDNPTSKKKGPGETSYDNMYL